MLLISIRSFTMAPLYFLRPQASTSDAEQRADDGSAEGIETAENGTAVERTTKPKASKKRAPRKTTKAPARIDGATTNRGEPSKTTLFVGNLPFTTDDEGLKDILQNYRVKSAHVVKRKT
jgi:RNA recognition motif-containing protein